MEKLLLFLMFLKVFIYMFLIFLQARNYSKKRGKFLAYYVLFFGSLTFFSSMILLLKINTLFKTLISFGCGLNYASTLIRSTEYLKEIKHEERMESAYQEMLTEVKSKLDRP